MTPKQISYKNAAETIIKNLKKRRMEGFYCENSEQALEKIKELIPDGSSIGWGGSMTLKETGIMDSLSERCTMIDRMQAKNAEEKRLYHSKIAMADFFLMSTNAITLDGELINIDGAGNRVANLCFGPREVIIVTGMNKVVSNVECGLRRVRDIASPANTVRLNKNTPCALNGRCGECLGEDSICSQIVVTRRSGEQGRIKVILIGEELGY